MAQIRGENMKQFLFFLFFFYGVWNFENFKDSLANSCPHSVFLHPAMFPTSRATVQPPAYVVPGSCQTIRKVHRNHNFLVGASIYNLGGNMYGCTVLYTQLRPRQPPKHTDHTNKFLPKHRQPTLSS